MEIEKFKILKSVLGSCYKSNSEYLFYCPFCEHHKKKLSVNIEKNVFKCWVCDKIGRDLGYLVFKFGANDDRKNWAKFEDNVDITNFEFLFEEPQKLSEQRIDLPKEFVSLVNRTRRRGSWPALRYLSKRGVKYDDILRWKIGFCSEGEYEGRIIIPSFDKEGYVNYFIARSYGYEWPSYKNPLVSKDIIFNELYLDWSKDIIIVEGVFDAIKAGNAVPLLGSTLRENSFLFQKLVKKKTKIYLALDEDAAKKSRAIAVLLKRYGLDVYKIDTSGFEDVGEMSKKEFEVRKMNASFVCGDDYLLERLSAI